MRHTFAWFSQAVHDATGGVDTVTVMNPTGLSGKKGDKKSANYFGASISGKPGNIDAEGAVTYPPQAETYTLIGLMHHDFWVAPKPVSAPATATTPAHKPGNGTAATITATP